MPLENRREKGTVASADVHKFFESGEVVGIEHRVGFGPMMAGHRFIEDRAPLRMFAEVFERRHAERLTEPGVTGPNGIEQPAPRLIQLLSVKPGVSALATVAAERLGQGSQHEAPLGILGEYPDTCQGAEHAVQHVGLHAGRFTELFRMFRAIAQEVRNAQFGRNENRLRRPIAADQLIHLSLEICWS